MLIDTLIRDLAPFRFKHSIQSEPLCHSPTVTAYLSQPCCHSLSVTASLSHPLCPSLSVTASLWQPLCHSLTCGGDAALSVTALLSVTDSSCRSHLSKELSRVRMYVFSFPILPNLKQCGRETSVKNALHTFPNLEKGIFREVVIYILYFFWGGPD